MRKHNVMVLLRPDGRTERYTVPVFWTAEDVANKLRHSEVFQRIPNKETVWGYSCPEDTTLGILTGPIWVMWDRDREAFVKVYGPDEQNANAIYRAREKS